MIGFLEELGEFLYFAFVECWWFSLLCILCTGLIVLLGIAAVENERKWQEFAKANECVVTETIPESTSVQSTFVNGKAGIATFTQPERNKYVCKDESVHWR